MPHVTAPVMLLALLALPLFLLGARRAPLAAACRVLAAACLVLVLAGLRAERATPAAGACVVAAIDVSASAGDAAVDTARPFLAEVAGRLGPADVLATVAFAAGARIVAPPRRGRRAVDALLPAAGGDLTGLETGETDLALALATAAPLCPADKQAALVLFTDGNETRGSLLAEAALLEPRLPIYAVVPAAATRPAATVRRLLAPAFAPEQSILPLQIVLESHRAAPLAAELRVTANDRVLSHERVDLGRGLNVYALPYRLTGPGHYRLRADLRLAPDVTAPPRAAETTLTVTAPVRVLVVSERRQPVVARALAERGMQVEVIAPAALARRLDTLATYHLLVLENVAHAALGAAAPAALSAWVADGGGLVATGGPHLFADPDLAGSPLAHVLPVEPRAEEPIPREREPIALYLLIDRSNSMGYSGAEPAVHNGEKMAYAKRAALAVLRQLGDEDLVGAVAFDSHSYELGPLAPAGTSRDALALKIRRLRHAGGTDFKDALDLARRSLLSSGRSIRHVILLTDGDTNRAADDHAAVIGGLARARITVTTIRVGSDTVNVDLLDAISRATGGEFHHVENVRALPQLMIRDTRRVMEHAPGRGDLRARIADGGTILAGLAEAALPPISHWAPTRLRRGAELRLYVETGDEHAPLLATWQYELGRSAVVPMDFQAGAATWPSWPGFGKLWVQLAQWTAAPGRPTDHHLAARRVHAGTLIELTTYASRQGPYLLRLEDAGDVPLHQTGPRTFHATVPRLRPGLHRGTLLADEGRRIRDHRVALMVPARASGGREDRARAPNVALLEQVAALTGGTVAPTPDAVLAARAGVSRETVALDWLLVPLALALLLADVALRRLGDPAARLAAWRPPWAPS